MFLSYGQLSLKKFGCTTPHFVEATQHYLKQASSVKISTSILFAPDNLAQKSEQKRLDVGQKKNKN